MAAVTNIEQNIAELGQIFNKLGTMVAEQNEVVIRLDENVDEAMNNVSSGEKQLQKYLQQLQSNKVLLAKIFGIVMFFSLFYIVVLA